MVRGQAGRPSPLPVEWSLDGGEEGLQSLAVAVGQGAVAVPDAQSFLRVQFDRLGRTQRAAIVQQLLAEAQAPERRGFHFVRPGIALPDPIAGAEVVQEEIRVGRHWTAVERGIAAGSRLIGGTVAGSATNRLEQLLAALAIDREGQAGQGSKEPHRIGQV